MPEINLNRSKCSIALGAAAVLVACGASAGAAGAPRARAPAPPVIKEGFTPRPCPRSRAARQTTLGAEACLERQILKTDAAINKQVRSIFGLLLDVLAKRRFVSGEKAWRTYRTKSCVSEADVYRGGTAEPLAFADCVVRRNRQHIADLKYFHATLRMR